MTTDFKFLIDHSIIYTIRQAHVNSNMSENNNEYWEIPNGLDTTDFDFSWLPDMYDNPYIHQFPTSDNINGGPRLIIEGSTQVKYYDNPVLPYKLLDIIFVSNGETGEQRRYDRLCQVADRSVEWIRGINGREDALRYAAETSKTEWFFCFPAKLYADSNFNFNFQPNRMYEHKHYIFYAKNPLNGLVYGHQAAVCYNRQLVLETIDYGLDFTMSKLHDIVPVVSGIAEYNSDLLMTWRTAFREAIKLKAAGDAESLSRLDTWVSYAQGNYCEWSVLGSQDGVEYYDNVIGVHTELMKSFSWDWLKDYFNRKYP